MIASDKRVTLFGNNVDRHDASFSSYLNENTTMVLKLTHPSSHVNSKKKVEDGEIGIFGAEKYFKGTMDEQVPRTPHAINTTKYHPQDQQEKYDQETPKPKTGSVTPSVRSEASCNSRSGLLVNSANRTRHQSKREKTSVVKSLFISLGCNCNDNKSVKVTENKVLVKEPIKPPVKSTTTFAFSGGFVNENKKEDCFSFPVMKVSKNETPKDEENDIIHVKTRRNSLEGFGSPILEKGKKSFSLERKLTMLNWDGVTPRAENINMTGENNDAASDASSDLFEIESFSTNGNNSFLARQASNGRSSNATLPNGYAPSEASIAWSVVTATGFSIVSDYEDAKMTKNNHSMTVSRGGILSGCNSHKSVRVSGEHVVVGGGEKAGMGNSTTPKDRCRFDPITPVLKFQAENKSMSSFPRGHSAHASHHLYIQHH